MSLKAFHIIFIIAAILLALGCGVWLVKTYFSEGGAMNLVFAALSFVTGIALIFYERYFLKKSKDIGYL